MKSKVLILVAAIGLFVAAQCGLAAETNSVAAEFKDLYTRIQAKLKDGKRTEKDLAPELKAFDELLDKHKGEKTDDVAQVLLMKAALYLQVLDNQDKAVELIKQLKRDFPDTSAGKRADTMLTSIARQADAKKLRAGLVEGAKFPDFDEKDIAGKPLSVANYKGKVVLIDFWATWCGPCVNELPNVLSTYTKHHAEGFEIIGVSLDEKRSELDAFLKDKQIPWQQFFDGQGWGNKLSTKYGVDSIPATYLLDGEGKIIGKDLRGDALENAVVAALKKR